MTLFLSTGVTWPRTYKECFPHVLDRDLTPFTGREIFKFEWTVQTQRLKQSSDFTVFHLGEDHFQM